MKTAAIILAAGAATRMGQIKQLLPYKGITLVEHAIQTAFGVDFNHVVVVVGAEAERVQKAARRTEAAVAVNVNWKSGMGSSITTGLAQMPASVEAVAILLADQPFVTADHLMAMKRRFIASDRPVLAASYGGSIGVPAFFSSSYYPKLRALPPEAGAKALLRVNLDVEAFELPEALTDIDTPADLLLLGL